jgi:hypothetical protein
MKQKNAYIVVMQPQEFAPLVESLWRFDRFVSYIGEIIKENNLDVEIWIGTFESDPFSWLNDIGITIKTWPMYWAFHTEGSTNYSTYDPNATVDRLFVSLNCRCHPHRSFLIDSVFQRGLQDVGYISWHNVNRHVELEHFDGAEMTLTEPENDIPDHDFFQHAPPYEYCRAAFALISETSVEQLDISEKTFTAILYKMPFILQATPGIHKILEDYGFRLYTELFDYEFDSVKDTYMRTNMILDQVEQYRNSDYGKLKQLAAETAQHNYDRLMDIVYDKDHRYVPKEIIKHFPRAGLTLPGNLTERLGFDVNHQ